MDFAPWQTPEGKQVQSCPRPDSENHHACKAENIADNNLVPWPRQREKSDKTHSIQVKED